MAMNHGAPSPSPMPRAGVGAGHSAAPGPPAPMSNLASGFSGGGGGPAPSPISGGGAPHVGGGSGPTAAPAPTRATSHGGGGGGGGGGPAIAVAPSVARPTGGGGGEGVKGNPDANNNPNGRPSLDATKDVDFGPYMADLQRRIKRAWFPPKGNESKRVVVQFKVHRGGELSNLRIDHSSGVAVADQAALKAVENAAPFRPLPAGRLTTSIFNLRLITTFLAAGDTERSDRSDRLIKPRINQGEAMESKFFTYFLQFMVNDWFRIGSDYLLLDSVDRSGNRTMDVLRKKSQRCD